MLYENFQYQEKTSFLLEKVLSSLPEEKVQVGFFLRQFDRRSYAGIFFILGLLCLLPGISILAGFVLIMPSLQLFLGFRSPSLPEFFDKKTVRSDRLKSMGKIIIPFLKKIEKYVEPRMLFLSKMMMIKMISLIIFILAIIVAVPFPLSNYPPAIALLFFSIGFLEKDGLMILIGLFFSLISLIFGVAVFQIVFIGLYDFLSNIL